MKKAHWPHLSLMYFYTPFSTIYKKEFGSEGYRQLSKSHWNRLFHVILSKGDDKSVIEIIKDEWPLV